MKTPALEVKNVSVAYDGQRVLESISFQIFSGEYVGVVGPNGGGKTTLLKVLVGLLPPSTGQVFLFGEPFSRSSQRSAISYVPQHQEAESFLLPVTVEEIVHSGQTGRPSLGTSFQDALEKVMKEVKVLAWAKRPFRELSGGQRQRVLIARALAGDPKILLLDEPTVGVDYPSQKNFYLLLRKLREKMGLTIILVSHDIDVVAQEVETVLCLNVQLVCHGTPSEVVKQKNLESLYGNDVKFIHHHAEKHSS